MADQVDLVMVLPAGLAPESVLSEIVYDAIVSTYDDPPDADDTLRLIDVRFRREREDGTVVYGVSLMMEVDGGLVESAIEQVMASLDPDDNDEVLHVVKFADPVVETTQARISTELFEIEMRLRQALSLIFLARCGDRFYEMLDETGLKFPGGRPAPGQMRSLSINELFYISFGDYPHTHGRKGPTQVNQLLQLVAAATDFEDFQRQVSPFILLDDEDAAFIAGLQPRLQAIEEVRNCIAHNRPIPEARLQDYHLARPALLNAVETFLASFRGLQDRDSPAAGAS